MEILITLKKTLPILLVIFVVVFFLILLTRLILFFCVNQAHKRYQNLKKIGKKILPKSKKYLKEDEELSLKKNEIPRANSAVKAEMKEKKNSHQSGSYEIIPSEEQELDKQEMNRVDIVDIVKPIGFWTSMILGQKLTYLIQSAQTLKKRDDKGFWASMVEAKERQAGRQHARGR